MSWDYANLSHLAKEAGGPDLLLNSLESSARGQGRIEGAGIGALAAGTLLVAVAYENHEPDLDTLLGGGNVGAEEGK